MMQTAARKAGREKDQWRWSGILLLLYTHNKRRASEWVTMASKLYGPSDDETPPTTSLMLSSYANFWCWSSYKIKFESRSLVPPPPWSNRLFVIFFFLFNFLLIASFQWRLISSRDACAIYAKLGLRGGTISFHVWQNFCPPAAAVRTDNRSPDLPFPVVNLSKLRHPSVMLCNLAFCNKFCFAFLPVGRSLLTNYSSITQQATKPLK